MASLYDRPDLYDLISPDDPAMVAFYLAAAQSGGPRVLELACGTGRVTIPLEQAGLDVTGGDTSPSMLDAARRTATARGVAPAFVLLDMRHFDLGRQFETVMITGNSLLHLNTAEDFEGFFSSVRRHLAPGGRLAFDIFVPGPHILARDPSARHYLDTVVHPTLGAVTLEETVDYRPSTQLSHITWYWSTPAERDFWTVPLILRNIFPQELPALLGANHFRLVERFGNVDKTPFDDTSWRQVCLAAPT